MTRLFLCSCHPHHPEPRTGGSLQVLVFFSIRSLSDLKDSKGDSNKKKTSSFTGGEKSGLAVENPSDDEGSPDGSHHAPSSLLGGFAHAV